MQNIVVENLNKSFFVSERQKGFLGSMKGLIHRKHREVKALNSISFRINHGECIGYIGPNGAGKSTTIKVLSGILVPDSGRCTVAGFVPWLDRKRYVATIGVVFGQKTQLWWDLPVIESFELLRDIYRLEQDDYQKTLDELIALLDLSRLLDVPVRQLSLGQRMRCDLAASLIHRPKILFLDEPTIGLDAISKLAVRRFIKDLNAEKKVTVILTTHDMDDIESLCKRVLVIGNGEVIYDGDMRKIRSQVSKERRLILDLEDSNVNLTGLPVKLLQKENGRLHLSFDSEKVSATKLIQQLASLCEIKDVFVENPPIEETIAKLYQERKL